MKPSVHLLVIDPQNDFCDLPESCCPRHPVTGGVERPALPVPGSHADLLRVAELIERAGSAIGSLTLTLDTHLRCDIAHPGFWAGADGTPPAPFTEIRAFDVRAGRYLPRDRGALPRVQDYLDTLEAAGRYRLMIWPVHCEQGSWGHAVHAALRTACHAWEDAGHGQVRMLTKGLNPWTEHYSAVQAEVPDDTDPDTQLNEALLATLRQADCVLIAGQAASHCVKATTEHIVQHIGAEHIGKLVLLTDCMSPVAGFEAAASAFLHDMQGQGVRLARAAEVLPDLAGSDSGPRLRAGAPALETGAPAGPRNAQAQVATAAPQAHDAAAAAA